MHFSRHGGKNIQFMNKYRCCFAFFLISCLAVNCAVSQEATKPGTTKPAVVQADYSKEAFVDEDDITKISFENDGTGTREWILRIRIQSDAGVQRYSVLTFPYQQATDKLDIDYVPCASPMALSLLRLLTTCRTCLPISLVRPPFTVISMKGM